MRSFIAIELSENIKNFLSGLIKVNSNIDGVSIVKKDNFHITLKFLGEIEESLIEPLSNILKNVASEFEPFTIRLTHPGVFPDKIKPRVIWISTENNNILKELAKRIDERLYELGFEREKREFKSHITLARVKDYQNGRYLFEQILKSFKEKLSKDKISKDECIIHKIDVKEFVLMKSTLTPRGSIYEVIDRFPLSRKINGIIKQNA